MAVALTVLASVPGYHVYMDQWETKIDTVLFFELELGENMTSVKGVKKSVFVVSQTVFDLLLSRLHP